jgi:bifunctional non-homologous end joining protein LigD
VPPRKSTHRSPARFIARTLRGAKPAPFPGFIVPCLATLKDEPPAGPRWVHELKLDGYRAQASFHDGRATIYSRRGNDWTARFGSIGAALQHLPANGFVIDGEVVVPDDEGRPNFGWLQDDLAEGRTDRMLYYAFDLLWLDGFDIRTAPLVDRKRILAELLEKAPHPIVYSEHFEIEGPALYDQACRLGVEGTISKVRDAPYRSGRGETWIKVKCWQRRKFVVVGFVPESSAGIAALRLGEMRNGKLMYAGKVGTGWGRAAAADIRRQMDALVRKTSPLDERIRKPDTLWVEPRYEADVAFADMTDDGLVRHPSFHGLSRLPEPRIPSPRDRLAPSPPRARAARSDASLSARPSPPRTGRGSSRRRFR